MSDDMERCVCGKLLHPSASDYHADGTRICRKMLRISDFLTDAEIERCIQLFYKHGSGSTFVDTVENEIITPNIERINKALGQPNYSRYLAYLVEFVCMETERQRN